MGNMCFYIILLCNILKSQRAEIDINCRIEHIEYIGEKKFVIFPIVFKKNLRIHIIKKNFYLIYCVKNIKYTRGNDYFW